MFNEADKPTSVVGNITQNLNLESSDPKVRDLFRLCVKFAVRSFTASEFSKEVRKVCGFAPSLAFRTGLTQNVYFLRNFRAFVVKMSDRKKSSIEKYAEKYEISKDDLKMAGRCFKTIREITLPENVCNYVCNLKRLDRLLKNSIMEIQQHTIRFVKKKLYFILASCNYEVMDLVNELLCKAVVSFYHSSILAKSLPHCINSMRATCTNQGQNMIKYFTAQKRSRLNKIGDSFALTIVSQNQSRQTEEDISYEDLQPFDNTETTMLNMSVRQLQERYIGFINAGKNVVLNHKKLRFINLLMGNFDQEFSTFLRNLGIHYANDDYQDRVQPKKYIELVSKFLKLSKETSENLLKTLRQCLAG